MFYKNILVKETLLSNAKVNIGLNIFDKLKNGYHVLESLIQEISLSDSINIQIYKETGSISMSFKGLPIRCPENKNTCYKIADYIKQKYSKSKNNNRKDLRIKEQVIMLIFCKRG